MQKEQSDEAGKRSASRPGRPVLTTKPRRARGSQWGRLGTIQESMRQQMFNRQRIENASRPALTCAELSASADSSSPMRSRSTAMSSCSARAGLPRASTAPCGPPWPPTGRTSCTPAPLAPVPPPPPYCCGTPTAGEADAGRCAAAVLWPVVLPVPPGERAEAGRAAPGVAASPPSPFPACPCPSPVPAPAAPGEPSFPDPPASAPVPGPCPAPAPAPLGWRGSA